MYKRIISIILIALMSATAFADTDTYEIDQSHSRVGFKISHLSISNVLGTFGDFKGTFSFDPEAIEKSTTDVKIEVKSVDTSNKKRNDHLRGEDFFEVKKYPLMTFKSKKVTKIDDKNFKVVGDLTIKETTKPVTLDVTYKGSVKDPWGNHRAGFVATTNLNRKDYGLTWNKTLDTGGLVVGDEVEIEIEVEGIKKKA